MVLPLLAAGLAFSGAVGVSKGIETLNYWNDYRRNTGHYPKYPWRMGVGDVYSSVGRSMVGFGAVSNFGYLPRLKKNYDVMYG